MQQDCCTELLVEALLLVQLYKSQLAAAILGPTGHLLQLVRASVQLPRAAQAALRLLSCWP